MAVMKLRDGYDGAAPISGDRAGELLVKTQVIDLSKLTTHANSDVVQIMYLPAYHRLVDFMVFFTGDYDSGASCTLDFGVLDDAEDGTVDKTILGSCTAGTAGLTFRLGVATYGNAADTSALLQGYFAINRPVGMFIREHSGLSTTGTIVVTMMYTPIAGWETAIADD